MSKIGKKRQDFRLMTETQEKNSGGLDGWFKRRGKFIRVRSEDPREKKNIITDDGSQELSMNNKQVKHDSWNKTPEFILNNSNPTAYVLRANYYELSLVRHEYDVWPGSYKIQDYFFAFIWCNCFFFSFVKGLLYLCCS